MVSHTTTNLRRWSCQNRELPSVPEIKAIHIYDFDNTLFHSPLPNPKLWTGQSVGMIQSLDVFANGSWWHDPSVLGATGQGLEKEEPRAWEGWWNEQIVNLVKLSMKQKDALTVLLTGRAEGAFDDLIKRMVSSRGLSFDLICLKQKVSPAGVHFRNTVNYKETFLEDLLYTYKNATEVKLYEDRPKHTRSFRDFFERQNRALLENRNPPRHVFTAEVVQVAELAMNLDPVVETAEVQRMVNLHNATIRPPYSQGTPTRLKIKRTFFFTGYLLSPDDTTKLLSLITLPSNLPESEFKLLANNILITPRPAQQSILDKVGGLGAKQIWQVTGTAVLENKVWAARVVPLPSSASIYTENPTPIVVLALRKGAKPIDATRVQNWQPVAQDKQFVFETYVGEKVQLRVEPEVVGEEEYESLFVREKLASGNNNYGNGSTKRRYDSYDHGGGYGQRGDDSRRQNPPYRGGNHNRGRSHTNPGGGGPGGYRNFPPRDKSGRNGGRGAGVGAGGGGVGSGGNRGGRGKGTYKSLDDVSAGGRYHNGHAPNYDDGYMSMGGQGGSGGGLPYGQ